MNSLSTTNNSIDFSRGLLSFGNNSIGSNINWSKIFKDKTGVYYPKAINWNNSTKDGLFDTKAFIIERSGIKNKVEEVLEVMNRRIQNLNRLKERQDIDPYNLKDNLDSIIEQFRSLFFLGEYKDGIGEIYNQDFFKEYQCVQKKLEYQLIEPISNNLPHQNEQKYLERNSNLSEDDRIKDSIVRQIATIKCLSLNCLNQNDEQTEECIVRDMSNESLIDRISFLVEKGLEWKDKALETTINKEIDFSLSKSKEYIKEDQSLNVSKVLEVISTGYDWDQDSMLIAFYNSKCSKEELSRLQKGVFNVLNTYIKSLNISKLFTIMEYILPFIFDNLDINFEIPEIFLPIYLNQIEIHDLTLESFTKQVNTKGISLGWSEELRNKLIDQFKEFGQDTEGKIAFGQGSEQLWYWQRVVGGINTENVGNYMIKEDLGVEHRPKPMILDEVESVKSITNNSLLSLI